VKKAELAVERRRKTGKNAARELRRQQKIPAVLYGRGTEPIPLAVDYQNFTAILHGQESRNTLFKLRISGEEKEEVLSLPKALQFHPVEGTVIHVDFQQIHLDERIHTQIPIHIVGSSPGVKAGGILEHLTRALDVECLPMEIPEFVEVDISGLQVGDSLHVGDLKVADNIRILRDSHQTVVLVAAPAVEKEPTPEEVEAEIAEDEEKKAAEGKAAGEPEKAEATSEKKN